MTVDFASLRAGNALSAYQAVSAQTPPGAAAGSGFGDILNRALSGVITTGKQADAQATQAIAGNGDLTQVVTAVSRAQLALQTTVAVRDRVLQAYQDIIKMPI